MVSNKFWRHFSKDWKRHLYAFGAGTVAGGMVGAVGWGGAQVLIPALTARHSLANAPQLSATGVSLTSLSWSTVSTGWEFWHENKVHVPLALMIGIPAVVSARIGTQFAKRLSGDALELIFNCFSIVLMPTHFWIQERAKLRRKREENDDLPADPAPLMDYDYRDPDTLSKYALFGLASGLSSSLMGVGGLPLTMSFLTETTNLEHHIVQGTAVCAVIPAILTSAASRMKSIPLVTAGVVCVGSAIGGYVGAAFALFLDDEQLRTLYMGSLVVFGGRSMYGAGRNLQRIWKA